MKLINGKWEDVQEYYKLIDLTDAYADELDNLHVTHLDDEDLRTFLCECLDEEVEFVWEMVKSQNNCADFDLIDFDYDCRNLYQNQEIEVKLSDELTLNVNINIHFKIDYDSNNPRYDDSDCAHNYQPFCVTIDQYLF